MKHLYIKPAFFLFLAALVVSCDEGRIFEESVVSTSEGINVRISGQILDAATWPSAYTVSIAAFSDKDGYAVVTKSIGVPEPETGIYDMTLANIPAEATSIEICAIDRLRRRVATFWRLSLDGSDYYDISIPSPVDANMFNVLQHDVFSPTCANCHGASAFAAAGLYLTEGKSYGQLVGMESSVMADGSMRVAPGSRKNSILYMILAGDLSAEWQYDHSVEIVDDSILELIGAWIDGGAEN